MTIRFIKPDGSVHDSEMCEPNLNLLAHAQAIELDIGSECGGHGACGKDRIQVPVASIGDLSPPSDEEKHHFTEAEFAQGWRLACQCFPENRDVKLDVGFES